MNRRKGEMERKRTVYETSIKNIVKISQKRIKGIRYVNLIRKKWIFNDVSRGLRPKECLPQIIYYGYVIPHPSQITCLF